VVILDTAGGREPIERETKARISERVIERIIGIVHEES